MLAPLVAFWGTAAPTASPTASPAASAQLARPDSPCIPQQMWCNKN